MKNLLLKSSAMAAFSIVLAGCVSEPVLSTLPKGHPANPNAVQAAFAPEPNVLTKHPTPPPPPPSPPTSQPSSGHAHSGMDMSGMNMERMNMSDDSMKKMDMKGMKKMKHMDMENSSMKCMDMQGMNMHDKDKNNAPATQGGVQ